MRHFEAHVESKAATRLVTLGGKIECTWYLPALTARDLAKLKRKPIKGSQVAHWNKLVRSTPAPDIFKLSLDRLKNLLLAAESTL